MRDLKILALRADQGGCAFYRIQEPVRVVTEQFSGVEIEVSGHLPVEAYVDRKGNFHIEKLDTDADVIIFQRPLLSTFQHVIQHAQRKGIACVVELDDDFSSVHPDNIAWHALQPSNNPVSNYKHVATAAMMADHVTVSTPALARRYGTHGRVSVLRNYIPAHVLDMDKKIPDDPRVGWTGTVQTHPHDLDVTGPHVGAALARWGTEFSVVGDGEDVQKKLNIPERIKFNATGWVPRDEYFDALAENIDIGIVPLELSPFNQAKSWLKGLEMAALGIPFIASPTDEYLLLAQQGAGTLASKTSEWQKHLKRLLTDRDYLLEASAETKQAISTFTYEQHAEEWVKAWVTAYAHRRRNPA